MKFLAITGSPRKNANTAKVLGGFSPLTPTPSSMRGRSERQHKLNMYADLQKY